MRYDEVGQKLKEYGIDSEISLVNRIRGIYQLKVRKTDTTEWKYIGMHFYSDMPEITTHALKYIGSYFHLPDLWWIKNP